MILLLGITTFAQLSFTVNSLDDDINSYPYDDPNTPTDESVDGICNDESGRCTIRAAIEEANNMNQSVNLTFSVSGTINLLDALYLPDGSSISGNNQVTLASSLLPLSLANNNTIQGLKISGGIVGIDIQGDNNNIGVSSGNYNEIVNCISAGISIYGNDNKIYNNFIGITFDNQVQPNGVGILISEGNNNRIGLADVNGGNVICNNTNTGLIIGFGTGTIVENNYIGTNIEGQTGFGNVIGISLTANQSIIGGGSVFAPNTISGNQIGIAVNAAPPDVTADQNIIQNNIIGLSKQQDVAVPNNNGISITNGVTNTKIFENVIAGNTASGIGIFAYDAPSYTNGHLIYGNRIGINKNDVEFGNGTGISIYGNVEDVTIGVDEINNYVENTIIGNQDGGIDITSFQGYSPNEIVFRKNIIHSNTINNLYIDTLSNLGLDAPSNLSYNGNALSGIHPLPSIIIDVYRANRFELAPSAYEWLGSTNTTATGNFSYLVNDPTVDAIAVTATNPLTGSTSGFARVNIVTAVEDKETIPSEFSLAQNYPNPFNPNTTIRYSLPSETKITISISNLLGQEITTLVDEIQSAGFHEIIFNASNLSSGVYIYKLNAVSSAGSTVFSNTKKLILLK
jgi:hypothetical protein